MSEEYVYLYGPCPACLNSKNSYWTHKGCFLNTEISNYGYIRCSDCYRRAIMFNWRFRCENHDYKEASRIGFATMLQLMTQLGKASPSFILQLGRNLEGKL